MLSIPYSDPSPTWGAKLSPSFSTYPQTNTPLAGVRPSVSVKFYLPILTRISLSFTPRVPPVSPQYAAQKSLRLAAVLRPGTRTGGTGRHTADGRNVGQTCPEGWRKDGRSGGVLRGPRRNLVRRPIDSRPRVRNAHPLVLLNA